MLDPTSQYSTMQIPLTLRQESDTLTPRSIVPIFLVHTVDKPFCINPYCECHQKQEQIAKLLEETSQGKLTLREAADFANGKAF
jgi:hypothetical protein